MTRMQPILAAIPLVKTDHPGWSVDFTFAGSSDLVTGETGQTVLSQAGFAKP